MTLRTKKFAGIILNAALLSIVGASQAKASGFEKTIMFGGQEAGVAGIAAPYVSGSEALYFNPAGLVGDKVGQDVSFNLSPTMAQFSGPIDFNNDTQTSNDLVMPVSLMYGKTLNDQFGVGIGYFVSGGSKADFADAGFGLSQPVGTLTDLTISEVSIGAGYKVNDRLKVGVSYRWTMVRGNISTVAFVPALGGNGLINAQFTQLKANDFTGFRLGAQYKINDSNKVGLVYRSEVNVNAAGNVGGQVNGAGGFQPINADTATLKTTFPMQIALSGENDLSDTWKLFEEYEWTQYSRVNTVQIDGQIASTPYGGSFDKSGSSYLRENWLDQHSLRAGAQYSGFSWPIRFGLGWTSQVTGTGEAQAQFTAPGQAYTLTAGTGHVCQIGDQSIRYDIAGEYSWLSGSSSGGGAAGDKSSTIRSGTFTSSAAALHLGVAYNF
jgi:long-chain fatty acid transport protein